jgi:signal transduction histidine kinase
MFKLQSLSPAVSLALRITLSILGILLGILCLFIAVAYERSENIVERVLRDRIDQVIARPGVIGALLQDRARTPPFARNLIIIWPKNQVITGFLSNSEFDLKALKSIRGDGVTLLDIENEWRVYIIGRSIGERFIYAYEPADLARSIGGKFLLWGSLAVIVFALGIFWLSLRIARQTLAPIEAAHERSRSYNRYLAHELKTPLSIVMSELELTQATKTYNEKLTSSSLEEIRTMSENIDGLLLLSEAERSPLKESLHLEIIVESIQNELQKIPLYSKRTIARNISGNTLVEADPNLLRALIKNLLLNALKHGAPDTIYITESRGWITLVNSLLPNTTLDIAHIFEEFTGTPGAGNGLGLSLCKRITDIHGWTLDLKQTKSHTLEVSVLFKE